MNKLWQEDAWEDYLYWQTQDKRILKRINQLLKDIDRNGYDGIGKPEPLRYEFQGFWSRRIDDSNRLVYRIKNGQIEIAQCGSHYRDKQYNGQEIGFYPIHQEDPLPKRSEGRFALATAFPIPLGSLMWLFWGLDESGIKRIYTWAQNTEFKCKLVVVVYPACPTGYLDLEELLQLRQNTEGKLDFRLYVTNSTRGGNKQFDI